MEKKKLQPLYIVGNIENGKFKQVPNWGGHSGNRLYSRSKDALNFFEGHEKYARIYKIEEVVDCTEELNFCYNDNSSPSNS